MRSAVICAGWLCHALVSTALVAADDPPTALDTVSVTADKLNVDHRKKEARFEGNVHAVVGVLTVECRRLHLTYNETGEIETLRASGGVTVVHQATVATASTAVLDAKAGILVLTGNPSLARGPHRLSGSRIEVHLKTGQLDIDQAKGTFRLKERRSP
jgi:lipopolysaccharide export system protein LptA